LATDLRYRVDEEFGMRDSQAPAANQDGDPCLNRPLFNVPRQLVKTLDRYLAAADIPKKDERGRSLDVHAPRHNFASLLSAGGVAPRAAQAALRHSDINLTMCTYTDPKVLDIHGALDALLRLDLSREVVAPSDYGCTNFWQAVPFGGIS
jgi:integrase